MSGHLRNPSLSRVLTPEAEAGLVDLIAGHGQPADVIWTDAASRLSFLPAGAPPKMLHTNAILSSEAARSLFGRLRADFDTVIVDLSPLAPVVDTRASVHFIDAFVYVVEWGRTRTDVVTHVLGNAREVHDNVLGAVLNKADLSVLGRYERHQAPDYHRRYYARYGYTT